MIMVMIMIIMMIMTIMIIMMIMMMMTIMMIVMILLPPPRSSKLESERTDSEDASSPPDPTLTKSVILYMYLCLHLYLSL